MRLIEYVTFYQRLGFTFIDSVHSLMFLRLKINIKDAFINTRYPINDTCYSVMLMFISNIIKSSSTKLYILFLIDWN